MINATKDKLQSYFQGEMQYVVPFFQRPYVWDEDNWVSLWENIVQIYSDHQAGRDREHFIGTIIVKQKAAQELGQNQYDLIDGQQRLTTICILLKSLRDSCKGQFPKLRDQIGNLLLFENARGDVFVRIRSSRNDLAYFSALIRHSETSALPNQDHKILRAYEYFRSQVASLSDEQIDTIKAVILQKVPVISMLLSSDDDEQVIFDTINSLGVKLTTAELLKNHIFKDERLEHLYTELWEPVFEADETTVTFWDKDKTAGRMVRKNIEVLLYCYLMITTQREIQLDSLYKEYKAWLKDQSDEDKGRFLVDLRRYAEYFADLPEGEQLNEIAYSEHDKRFFHIVENLSITTVYPLILFLYKEVTDEDELRRILRLLEGYLVRRNLCRLTTKNYNNLFISMIRTLARRTESQQISAESVKDIIASFSDETNRCPSDDEVRAAFDESSLSNQNAREILYLIALFQKASPLADVGKLSLSSYSVEHMMPVKWRQNWPIIDGDGRVETARDKAIRTLGNLTLVTRRLNSKLSNAPWAEKTNTLRKHSSLNITTDYLDSDGWDEARICSRAGDLAKLAIEMWPGL